MNEIEVKAKLTNKAYVLEALYSRGLIIQGKKYQKDTVFFPNDFHEIESHGLGKNFLRIREQEKDGEKRIFFTLKQPRSNQTDCIEHEIEIQEKDIPILTALIKTLGFYQFIIIEKERETGQLNDIEICLDEVKGLGSFIELEKFGPESDAPKIQNELYNLLESWGVLKEDYVYQGYDILVHKAQK